MSILRIISPPKLITIDAIIRRIIADLFLENIYKYDLLNEEM